MIVNVGTIVEDKVQILSKKIKKEYNDYIKVLLKLSKEEIMKGSGITHFYQLISDYFTSGDIEIDEDIIDSLINEDYIIYNLYYNVYLKYETVSYNSYEDIAYMIDVAIEYQAFF